MSRRRSFLHALPLLMACRGAVPPAAPPEETAIAVAAPPTRAETPELEPGEPVAAAEGAPATAAVAEPSPPPLEPEPPPTPPNLGPAALSVFVAHPPIASTPRGENLAHIYDHIPHGLFQSGGIDPLHDFDAVYFESPDLRDPTQAVVLLRHHLGQSELEGAIERSLAAEHRTIGWRSIAGMRAGSPVRPGATTDTDPRLVVQLDATTVAIARPERLPGPDGDRVGETARRFNAHLAAPAHASHWFAARIDDLSRFGLKVPGSPLPHSVEATLDASGHAQWVLTAHTNADATELRRIWVDDLGPRIKADLKLQLTIGSLYTALTPKVQGDRFELAGPLTDPQQAMIIQLGGVLVQSFGNVNASGVEATRGLREAAWQRRNGGARPPSAAVEPR